MPDHIAKRIPEGHTVHRHTGTMERTRINNANGQRNFILHPIPGEEGDALRFNNSAIGVTDLPIEEVHGQRVWLFSFIGPSGKISHFLCWSRSTGAWVTLHDEQVMVHLFEHKPLSVGKKAAFLGIAWLAGPKVADIYGKGQLEKASLSGPQAHQLILDIRYYLESTMQQPTNPQGQRL